MYLNKLELVTIVLNLSINQSVKKPQIFSREKYYVGGHIIKIFNNMSLLLICFVRNGNI